VKALRLAGSLALLAAIFLGADRLARALDAPVPGNVLGLLVLLVLLATGVVKLSWVETGADLLLRHLGLFFVPAAVAVLAHRGILRGALGALAVVVIGSTAIVMVVTGWVGGMLLGRDKREEER
jgi:holin-like protein